MNPRYVPFIVNRQRLEPGGSAEAEYFFVDFIRNKLQGFGHAARTLLIENSGNCSMQFQLCDTNGNWTQAKTMCVGTHLTYCEGDGLRIARMKAWSPLDHVGYISIDAMPGRDRQVKHAVGIMLPDGAGSAGQNGVTENDSIDGMPKTPEPYTCADGSHPSVLKRINTPPDRR